MSSQFQDRQGKPLSLALYMYDSCAYCQRVLAAMRSLGFDIPLRNIRKDPTALAELVRTGGSRQVPCLFINGQPLYKSADIIRYLQTEVRR